MSIITKLCHLPRVLAVVATIAAASAAFDPALAQTAAPANPPPAAEAKAAAPAPAVDVVENPYGMESLWKQGDFISRGTLVILMIMSMGSWYIGILKVLEQQKLFKQAKNAEGKFWQAASVKDGAASMDEDSAFRFVAESGATASAQYTSGFEGRIDLNSWLALAIQRAVDTVNSRLQKGLAFLATVGSTAPFVGLFGTVWGIYHALTAIGIAGQASIDKVAGPVGEALIMTALGLAVAVPAVLGYNWLIRRNRAAMEQIRQFGGGVHMTLIGTGVPAQQVGVARTGAKGG